MSKTYCLTVDLMAKLKSGPEACANMLTSDSGKQLTGAEAYAKLWEAWIAGYEVLPTCNNHDPQGHCLGHETGNG